MEDKKDMGSCRCPYLVRHGQYDKKSKSIVFTNQCALKIKAGAPPVSKNKKNPTREVKQGKEVSCETYPLAKNESYFSCETFRASFLEEKRDVLPSTEIDYGGGKGKGSSLLDLEML